MHLAASILGEEYLGFPFFQHISKLKLLNTLSRSFSNFGDSLRQVNPTQKYYLNPKNINLVDTSFSALISCLSNSLTASGIFCEGQIMTVVTLALTGRQWELDCNGIRGLVFGTGEWYSSSTRRIITANEIFKINQHCQ